MTICLELSQQAQKRLEVLASKSGQEVEAYVNALIEKTVLPIDDLLHPFRQGFVESDISEEDLSLLMEAELKAVRVSRHAKSTRQNQ